MIMRFDTHKILVLIGGANPRGQARKIAVLLKRYGVYAPNSNAIYMWRFREQIGPQWMPTLLYILFAEGLIEDIGDVLMYPNRQSVRKSHERLRAAENRRLRGNTRNSATG